MNPYCEHTSFFQDPHGAGRRCLDCGIVLRNLAPAAPAAANDDAVAYAAACRDVAAYVRDIAVAAAPAHVDLLLGLARDIDRAALEGVQGNLRADQAQTRPSVGGHRSGEESPR